MRKVFPAKVEYLDEVTGSVDAVLLSCGASDEVRFEIRLAVEEIFVNIADYGYPDGEGKAALSCALLDGKKQIRIRFTDSGIEFNPLAREDADTSEEGLLSREGGLGILLVKRMMDEVTYCRRHGKNVLTMVKTL
ncbi:MAG: ATP-binding protein [Lachnospiraceae bacterium]|nr:ATP-binding protein [Lachnospiraceae bacterium]